ncbi:MAG: replicative DNA helicase, partial [Janthinobacterium lividum]
DTVLPTPTGWTSMAEVAVGDELLGADGRPTTVVAATDVLLDRPCYEVRFSDGSVLVADAQHQWLTSRPGAEPAIRTTLDVARDLSRGEAHAVALTAPLDLKPGRDGGVSLTGLGAALASKGARLSAAEVATVHTCLRGSLGQRAELLAGFLDVAGVVLGDGSIELDLPAGHAGDVLDLVHGLGHQVRRRGGVVRLVTSVDVFSVDHQALTHRQRRRSVVAGDLVMHARYVVEVVAVPSVAVRCVEVDNEEHLYLAGRSMIPTHNSTLGLDIARSASIKHGLASVIFSLEMGRNEISMRLLSAEARIPLQNMRKGTMREDDWTKLARTMGAISEAPLYIDDSPNMSLMEIRSKCRRLKQRADLKLVIVDYLQLMTSGKRVESRQQEVSEFSRALKLLAKELEVPVIALSQLNRGPEQRTDKKPQMSDLRESGCLTADTRVLRADTGAETTMEELFALQARDVPVWTLDESLRYVRRHLTHVFPTGVKPVFRLRTSSGKEVRATANHPFLTYDGWKPLGELSVGDRLAVPRHVPGPERVAGWEDDHVVLLAHLLGDGSWGRNRPLRCAGTPEHLALAAEVAKSAFGVSAREVDGEVVLDVPAGQRNPVADWLDDLALLSTSPATSFVPVEVFALPKRQIAVFLRHLWSTRGGVEVIDGSTGRIHLTLTSRTLLEGVRRLLLRFGIATTLRTSSGAGGFPGAWTLEVTGVDEQRRFLQEIGIDGADSRSPQRLLDIVRARSTRPQAPVEGVWEHVRDVLTSGGPRSGGVTAVLDETSVRTPLGQVAEVLAGADLEVMAVNDVLWDEIVVIEPDGEEQVFDATVVGGHNFVANGIAVHNSIEQDADMVILLHREDMYEKESPRAGEADFIVAKHRNGPTDTICVAFQGHYSRFVDMAT